MTHSGGSAALKASLHDAVRAHPGAKPSVTVDSVKPLTSEVLVEKGSTRVISKTGEGERWLARETGYAADGSRPSSDQTITKAGTDR